MPQLSVLLITEQDCSNAMEIKELQDIIQQNGVVGAGGAGFPTYMKPVSYTHLTWSCNCSSFFR